MDGMIRHNGVVRAIADGQAHIAVVTAGCESCGHAGGCGIARLAGSRRETVMTLPAAGLRIGQPVLLSLDETRLTRAALLGYLLPAALLLAGAVFGDTVAGGELAAPLGALFGLAAGLLLTRLRRPLLPRLDLEPTHV